MLQLLLNKLGYQQIFMTADNRENYVLNLFNILQPAKARS